MCGVLLPCMCEVLLPALAPADRFGALTLNGAGEGIGEEEFDERSGDEDTEDNGEEEEDEDDEEDNANEAGGGGMAEYSCELGLL